MKQQQPPSASRLCRNVQKQVHWQQYSKIFMIRVATIRATLISILVSHKGCFLYSPSLSKSHPLIPVFSPGCSVNPRQSVTVQLSATISFYFYFYLQFTISFNPLFLQTKLLLNISSISTPSSTKSNQLNLMHSFHLKSFTI